MKWLWIIILAVLIAGAVFWFSQRGGEVAQTPQPTITPTQTVSPLSPDRTSPAGSTSTPEAAAAPKTVTVNITDAGFSPSAVTVNAGDTVRFVNQSGQAHWPASAVHPTHELYPGSGISKCGVSAANLIFDSCRGLKTGESFSFTFSVLGNWPYHDHLNPSLRGQIVVQ